MHLDVHKELKENKTSALSLLPTKFEEGKINNNDVNGNNSFSDFVNKWQSTRKFKPLDRLGSIASF